MQNFAEQLAFFKKESWNYFQRNYHNKNLREIPVHPVLEKIFQAYPININDGSMLEIGCGAASNLNHLRQKFRVNLAVGTDPSPDVVRALSQVFPEMEFFESDSRTLPFETGKFDLVLLRGVLCWVDRNYLLQTIGEAIRVARQYLIISEFTPHQPYSVVYHHQSQYRTYKMNYQPIVEATGFMRCLASLYWGDGDEWNVVQTGLFRKIPLEEAFPLREEKDFQTR
jgi:SAM-dependent methyltransferase